MLPIWTISNCFYDFYKIARRRFTEIIPTERIVSRYRSIISQQPTRNTESTSDLTRSISNMNLRGGKTYYNQDAFLNDEPQPGSSSSTVVPKRRHPSQQNHGDFRISVKKRSDSDDKVNDRRVAISTQSHQSQQRPPRNDRGKDVGTKPDKSVSPGATKRQKRGSPRNTIKTTAKRRRLNHEPASSETTNDARSAGNEPRKLTILEEKMLKKLTEIGDKAKPLECEIEIFEELRGSDKHYYIEESLRRLVDVLDDMFDEIGQNQFLRDERKKVYKVVFPLFEKLDLKTEENRKRITGE